MKNKHLATKPDPLSYRTRDYRHKMGSHGLKSYQVSIQETDLFILANKDVQARALQLVLQYRSQLENYIARHPLFLSSLTPLQMDTLAPPLVKAMLSAALQAGVGPMAAVAGTIAEFVGRELLHAETDEIIIENGGDIFMKRNEVSLAAIYAGTSPLTNKIAIKIPVDFMPVGICTSSGTIGHSLSFGQADSVTVLAPATPLADAAATRLGNEMKKNADMSQTLEIAKKIKELYGVVVVQDNQLGVWGNIELQPLES